MAKKKYWIYSTVESSSHGLMKCCGCGKKIARGAYRYYDAGEEYVTECISCGGHSDDWKDKIRKDEQAEKARIDALMEDSHDGILARIKDAFIEGWHSYSTPASAYNSPEEAWEESEAKEVVDALKVKWGIK